MLKRLRVLKPQAWNLKTGEDNPDIPWAPTLGLEVARGGQILPHPKDTLHSDSFKYLRKHFCNSTQ